MHPPPRTPTGQARLQDLLQIGDWEFYFLLPVRSILGGPIGPWHNVGNYQASGIGGQFHAGHNQSLHSGLPAAPGGGGSGYEKKGKGCSGEYYEEYNAAEEGGAGEDGSSVWKETRRGEGADGGVYGFVSGGKTGWGPQGNW